MNFLLPWQIEQWQQLQAQKSQGRLSHAMLLTGSEGMGKSDFVTYFSQALLCTSSSSYEGQPCQQCHSCALFQSGNHPDLIVIKPDEEGKSIKIGDIRNLIDFFSQTSHYSAGKIAIIFSAEKMNVAASNALLKTLEEPAAKQYIFLLTNRPHQISATVRSRCQLLHFSVPNQMTALNWLLNQGLSDIPLLLSLADGAPLRAKELQEAKDLEFRQEIFNDFVRFSNKEISVVFLSDKWLKLDFSRILWHLYSWVRDMVLIKLSNSFNLINQDLLSKLSVLAKIYTMKNLFGYEENIKKMNQLLRGQVVLNKQLLLENLLLDTSILTDFSSNREARLNFN